MGFELGNLQGRDLDLLLIAEREREEGQERADETHGGHPPDVPDQRKAGDDGEECVDEADRGVFRYFDRRIGARRFNLRGAQALLGAPKGIDLGDPR